MSLQQSVARQEHEANFVMSGVYEKDADERPADAVIQACKKIGITVASTELVEVRRLGRPPQAPTDGNRQSRPRPLLVKTRNKDIKTKIMTQARANREADSSIFFNEDLTKEEQARRRTLVPVYKELRKVRVKCRLDRASLVVNDRMIFDQDEAQALLHSTTQTPSSLIPPTQRSLNKSFAQAVATPDSSQ